MVDTEAQTEATLPASVVGLEKDILIGTRIRKSFGSGAFWGSVVGCYWVSGGLFYKVSFDDGDVDIFSADEVLQDAQEAKKYAKEDLQKEKSPNEAAVDDYFSAMRVNNLKRKRDDVVDHNLPNIRRVNLWGQRLYASIYTNEDNETFIKELLKTEDGKMGEMEATGQVKVGDMILAVNQTRVLGMVSKDLAELIRKPKRPITLTFFRPQRSQLPVNVDKQAQQQTQTPTTQPQQVQQPTTSTAQTQSVAVPAQPQQSAVAVAAQTQQTTSVPPPQPVVPPRQQVSAPVAMSSSFVRPQQTFVQGQLARGLAHQWTNSSQPFTTRDVVRHRLIQNAVARHGNFVPGYPMGVYVPSTATPFTMVPPPYGGDFSAQQYVVDTVAMRARSGQSAPSVQSRQIPVQVQQRNTGMTLQEKIQQLQSQRNSDSSVSELTTQATATGATANKAQGMSIAELERRAASQASHQATSLAPRDSVGSRRLSTHSLEAIAKLAETNPSAAQQFMRGRSVEPNEPPEMEEDSAATSFLSPSALTTNDPNPTERGANSAATSFLSPSALTASDLKPTERDTTAASHSMSFLSPNDFNVESSIPSRPEVSAANTANQSAPVTSNVSLVSVQVSRQRLYLTLGVQGTLIAVTSFVLDEHGLPGEVEKSGKVFLGDVLVRINDRRITAGMTPSHVAEIVNSSPRPMTLLFERASWDILDGQA